MRFYRLATVLLITSTWVWAAETPLPAAVTPALTAAGIPISGRIFSDVYLPIRDVESSAYRQSSGSLWLQGDPKLGEHGSARFILEGDAIDANNVAFGGSSGFHITLREGYVGYAKNGLEARLGRQILPWGKSDVINPTDFLSAKDYTFFNPDTEVQRIGATSLWFNWTPSQGNSPWNFTVVATPVVAQTKLLIPPSAIPTGISLSTAPVAPPQTLGNTETALKIAYNSSGWDASISAYRGFNHIPEFGIMGTTVNPTTGLPVAFQVGQVFHHLRALGSDGSFTTGRWIFRAETAYLWTENNDGTHSLIQPSHWDSVLGMERPLGDDFRVQVQFVYRYIPGWVSLNATSGPDPVTASVNQGIARANALLLAFQDQSRPGATFRFGYSNESNGVDAEVFLIGNFVGGDYLIRPKFTYSWTDALKTSLGVDYYGGPDDRPLGANKVFNSLFAEAKYSF